nr:hypothetical protein CFP56_53467 [Quercus suber]
MKDDDSMELEKRNEVTVEFLLQERWHLVLEIQQQAPPPFDGTPLQPQLCIASLVPLCCSSLSNFDSSLLTQGLVRIRALQICCLSHKASIKCLKDHLESEVHNLKKFKDSSQALGQEVIDLKAKLSGMAHQTDNLMKENTNLKSEEAALHEHIEKVKEEAIKEYQVSQPYFDEMKIMLTAPTTPATELTHDDMETDEEVLVTNGPGGVANDPMDPPKQTDNPPANP